MGSGQRPRSAGPGQGGRAPGPGKEPDRPVRAAEDGTLFLDLPVPFRLVTEVPEYWMDDIGQKDRVLDIGANAGAFCIRAARRSGHVVAVEPVTCEILAENIRLNGAAVKVIPGALGSGGRAEVSWDGRSATVPTYPLGRLVAMAGGCDFLKCDCEGAEWAIDPAHLSGIRRIEMELHQPPIGPPPAPGLLEYISGHYTFRIDREPCHGPLGRMGILHAWRE